MLRLTFSENGPSDCGGPEPIMKNVDNEDVSDVSNLIEPRHVEERRASRRVSRSLDVDDLERISCKVALTLREAAVLGLGSERVLRQMVVDGLIKKAVLPFGVGQSRPRYRLLREVLIKELKEAKR